MHDLYGIELLFQKWNYISQSIPMLVSVDVLSLEKMELKPNKSTGNWTLLGVNGLRYYRLVIRNHVRGPEGTNKRSWGTQNTFALTFFSVILSNWIVLYHETTIL